jgi:Ca-activated chloride channel family protein
VNIEAEIENLLCEVTIKQVYSNLEKVNIEAVYTFPLPLGAVLLDMTIKTKTKELRGVVIEKAEAEDRYEDAITDGDTAIMLEQVDPGLYTMNVGNLQPEDTIEISVTYAELFKWRDNSLRFFLPTTIAPRYGDPESVGIQPHQSPEYDLMADNPFSMRLTILGELADASFQSPSHRIQIAKDSEKTVISFKDGRSLMDRDFVLNILLESEKKDFALFDRDGDGYVTLASFYPKFPDVREKAPRCITIIVDCSGSMGGDSIAQARKALYEILELLRPEDSFNVIRFGSNFSMLFPAPVKAGAGNLKKARNLLEILDADMGGTEIGQAVAAAIKRNTHGKMSKDALGKSDGNGSQIRFPILYRRCGEFRIRGFCSDPGRCHRWRLRAGFAARGHGRKDRPTFQAHIFSQGRECQNPLAR